MACGALAASSIWLLPPGGGHSSLECFLYSWRGEPSCCGRSKVHLLLRPHPVPCGCSSL